MAKRSIHKLPIFVYSHFSGILNDMEFSCYCQWFDHLVQQNPPKLDLIGAFDVSRLSVCVLGMDSV